MLLRQCNLATIKIFCGQPAQKRYGCSNGNEQILRKVRNNYRSRNLIGHYPFWVISPRNSTSFTRPFLAGRRARAGHETIFECPCDQQDSYKCQKPRGRQLNPKVCGHGCTIFRILLSFFLRSAFNFSTMISR